MPESSFTKTQRALTQISHPALATGSGRFAFFRVAREHLRGDGSPVRWQPGFSVRSVLQPGRASSKVADQFCILQVEDDRNDVFFLEHAFRAAGVTHPLRVVRDGQEAIDYLSGAGEFSDRTRYPLPCLILLDLKLPRKDGFEVLAWIRQDPKLRLLQVIVLTSSARESDVDRAYLLGANSFLVKPSELKERVELSRLLKAYWLQYQRMPSICKQLV